MWEWQAELSILFTGMESLLWLTAIKRFLDEYENVEVKPMDLKINQRVIVTGGPLMDQQGKIVAVRQKTVKVAIDSLGYILVAHIERTKLSSVWLKPNLRCCVCGLKLITKRINEIPSFT
jgi:transcription antitermination factor NusG